MNTGVLGTGTVGRAIAAAVARAGHAPMIGTRDVETLMARPARATEAESFGEWRRRHSKVSVGTFSQAAVHGEIVFNATAGVSSLEALERAGRDNLSGKVIVDIANALEYSEGLPSLAVCNTDSLGEQIQRAHPDARVVKTLNTTNASVMVDPGAVGDGDHHVFVSGNDPDAKRMVTEILTDWFGWQNVMDLGDITTARGAEMLLPLWLRVMRTLQTPAFNFKIVT